ncbi:MAG TPA: glycosyltransferase [Gemmatimonadales bacterium]|nr:glycosyltransferase [Gemmatimonadales bacterium]
MLVVTNMYPSPADPVGGVFVERQVTAVAAHLDSQPVVLPVRTNGLRAVREARRAVRAAIDRIGPAVIHVFYGLTGITVPRTGGIPLVLTLCGSDILWGPTDGDWQGWMEYGVSVLTAWRAAAVAVQSQPLRDALPRGSLRDRTMIIPPGIDLELFRPMDRARCRSELGWRVDEPVVLFPANPDKWLKRYELARAVVEGLVTGAGRSVRLEVLAGVDPRRVPLHLNAADAVLITSSWEGGPLVLSEALACGTPVVSVPVGYARDPAWQCDHLRVVPAEVPRLRAATQAVLDHPPLHERPLGLTLPDSTTFGGRLAEVYARVVAGRGS